MTVKTILVLGVLSCMPFAAHGQRHRMKHEREESGGDVAQHSVRCGELGTVGEFVLENLTQREVTVCVNTRFYAVPAGKRSSLCVPYGLVSLHIPGEGHPRRWATWDCTTAMPQMVCKIESPHRTRLIGQGGVLVDAPNYGLLIVENKLAAQRFLVAGMPCVLESGRNEFFVPRTEIDARLEHEQPKAFFDWRWHSSRGRYEMRLVVE